ncbi:phage holin [Psychrobacillus lasiicapitis]|uniref:Phage holin n=1 Tax=Psychrobacillus lasiicapitis TaxID=1636719 RepID=A0A544TAK4_9BACI|nr:phage holin [Psychrobacillus lasiicapitis]TQR14485.1 phage holin [Psychrobacillus lasiicapitis]GGA30925.1 hypothetical protein GCM10011384_20540 [Psychrobacillus lasiicapitis]
MNINWKVRFKNKQFWLMVLLAITAPISAYYDVSGSDLTTWMSVWDLVVCIVSNPFVLFSIGVGIYNAIPDLTTVGVSDSPQALKYEKPKER